MYSQIKVQKNIYKIVRAIYLTYSTFKYDFNLPIKLILFIITISANALFPKRTFVVFLGDQSKKDLFGEIDL